MSKKIVLFGNNGILSSYLVEHFVKNKFSITLFTPHPNSMLHVLTSGKPGEIMIYDYSCNDRISDCMTKCDIIVNAAELDSPRFSRLTDSAEPHLTYKVIALMKNCKSKKLIQLSPISDDRRKGSNLLRRHLAGEQAMLGVAPNTIVVRSEVLFWKNMLVSEIDNMLTQIRSTAIRDTTLFRPLYAGDLAQLIVKIANDKSKNALLYNAFGGRAYSLESLERKLSQIVSYRGMFIKFDILKKILNFLSVVVKYIKYSMKMKNLHEIGLKTNFYKRSCVRGVGNDVEKAGIKTTRMETVI